MSAPVVPALRRRGRGRPAGRRLPARASPPRWSPTSPRASASPCWSRAPPASARPSWPRRSPTYLGRDLVRLQCYEGLDEAKALYEWNYRKQLLRIQAEADGTGWQAVQDDIFGEEFLLSRPLLQAIASHEPVVLLIDEIDKTDQEFEAMLLELLSDFQISIPELGRIEARTHPVVLLTSNNSRELTEALKRRCLYLWLDYPTRRARAGDRPAARARAARDGRAPARRGRRRWCASSTSRSRRRSPSRSTGRARCCCSAPRTSTSRRSATRCRSSSSTARTSTPSPSASACGSAALT